MPNPICTGCMKRPDQIIEYILFAKAAGLTPDEYVQQEEGTFNRANGHFLCTTCYIQADMPATSNGWVAP